MYLYPTLTMSLLAYVNTSGKQKFTFLISTGHRFVGVPFIFTISFLLILLLLSFFFFNKKRLRLYTCGEKWSSKFSVYRRKPLSLYDSCLENDVESMKTTECSIRLTVHDETDDSSSIWGSISLKAFRLFFRSVRERKPPFSFQRINLLFLDRETLSMNYFVYFEKVILFYYKY